MVNPLRISVLFLTLLGISGLPLSVQAVSQDSLSINISGLKSTRGQLCLSLYNKPESFPMSPEKSLQTQCVKITQNPMRVSFKNLASGYYAIAVLHDTNADGRADRNFMGLPMEGFGFSQNPTVSTTAPKFSQAAVKVESPNTSISIQMRYLPGAKT
jgi:uncharacterized protein (DUF2141 family)